MTKETPASTSGLHRHMHTPTPLFEPHVVVCVCDPVSTKLRQKDGKLKASLGYIANCSLKHTYANRQEEEQSKEQNNTCLCLLY